MYDLFISYNTQDQALADRTYEKLTQAGYRCFLSTHGITSADWAGDIMEALEQSKGFVVIVSKSAVISNEVMKEVTLATRYSRFIFPLRTDEAPMDRAMEYHLAPFQWIDAIIPPFEIRLEELLSRIQAAFQSSEKDGNYNESKIELLGQVIAPRAEFMGREETLADIHQCFSDQAHAVFLSGMGGIGKSELARAYAKKYQSSYDCIIMATFQTDLMQLFADDQAIQIHGFNRGGVNGGQIESLESYYKRKMQILRGLVTPRTLLIIDNFDVEDDPYLEEILELSCRFLVTTRTNFEEYGYETILLDSMDPETELLPIMERMDHPYKKEEERQAAREIIEMLDRHTYAVSLTASQMKAGHIKPQKMMEMLHDQGLRYQTRSKFGRTLKGEKSTAYGFIKMLFDFSDLNEKDITLLQTIYCTPQEGIDIDLFMELAEIDDFEDIHRLINLNWVQEDVEQDTIRLHMLVRELLEEEHKPKLPTIQTYFNNLGQIVYNAWHYTHEENLRYIGPTLAMLRHFPDLTIEDIELWDGYSTFCWIMNEFEISEKAALRQYELSCEKYGEISLETSFFALRVAAVYHNQNDFAAARPWYKKGMDIALALNEDSFDCAQAIFKVARSDMQNGDLESAAEGCEKARQMMIRVRETTEDDQERNRAIRTTPFVVAQQALLICGKGDYETAIEIAKEQYRIISEEIDNITGNYHNFLEVLAVVHGQAGMGAKAVEYAASAVGYCVEYHGEKTTDSLLCKEILGDMQIINKECQEAVETYKEVLNLTERYFPGDTGQIAVLEEKYQKALRGEVFEVPIRYLPL